MTEAIIFDLDRCLAEADEHPEILDPGFEAIRRANRGTLSEAELERALEECRRHPFHRVARERGFSDAMIEAGRRAFSRTVVRRPMTGYPDLPVLERLPGKKFLVTTGFRRLQESKIDALGVAPLFDGVHIDAIDDGRPRGKGADPAPRRGAWRERGPSRPGARGAAGAAGARGGVSEALNVIASTSRYDRTEGGRRR